MSEISLSEPVSKFVYSRLTTIASELSIVDAAKVMSEKKVESILVFEKENVIGIITDRDILNDVIAKGLDPTKVSVSEIVKKPLATIQKNSSVLDAINMMREKNIRRLLVMDGTRPLGLVRRKQLSGVLQVREIVLPELENPFSFTCPYCFSKFDTTNDISKHIDDTHFK